MSLQEKIDASIRETVARMAANDSWRCYSGPCQAELVSVLGASTGCTYAGLACSGSAALEMLLRAMLLTTDDEVMLSGYDYPGNFAAIERVGARPVLIDVEASNAESGGWQLSSESLDAAYRPQCKALIASHLHGQLQPIEQLQTWCQARGVLLVQDACQALGAEIDGQMLGAWGDAMLLSFGGTKVISAGRGGAWLTNQPVLAQQARRAAGVGSGAYEMSEFQAAIVLAQWPHLQAITHCCREYFDCLHGELQKLVPGIIAPWWPDRHQTAFYQAGWLLPEGSGRERVSLNVQDGTPVVFGDGFKGFHRRSNRRARIAMPLENVSSIVDRTVTLHHRLAVR